VRLGVAGVVLLAGFLWWETRAPEPILPLALFRSRVFSVANAMGFTIGMAMFGAIVFLPVFLQLVYGASPTSSGLRMLPLMFGLLTAAILSGRAISRMGRYRIFPIVGTAVLVVGMYLLSLLDVGSAPWVASVYMLVVGVGIGLVMQVIVLVVQNDARPQDMGLAAVPFILAWFLKEVPLRTTLAPAAELSVEQAPAAGTPEERLVATGARRRPQAGS